MLLLIVPHSEEAHFQFDTAGQWGRYRRRLYSDEGWRLGNKYLNRKRRHLSSSWYVICVIKPNVGLLPAPLGHWAVHCTRKGGGASVFHTSSINYAQSQWEAACCCQWSAVTSTTPAQHQAALHRWQGGWYACMQWWLWSLSPIKLL